MAYIEGEFINLYSKDNPILETDDICYALIFSTTEYHMPLVIRGVIRKDVFVDGMNKQYYIEIQEILETPNVIKNFFIGKQFVLYPAEIKKTIQISPDLELSKYLIKVDAYFVRNSEEKIQQLRTEYISIVKSDLERMLSDLR